MGFVVILVFLLLGVVLQRVKRLPVSTALRLIQYVLYIAMPALVLLHLPRLHIDAQIWVPIITPWVMLIISMLCVVVLCRKYNWSRPVMGALLIVVPLGNTSFLGFPIVQSLYGDQGLAYAVLYDQFGSFIGLSVVATALAVIFGTHPSAQTQDARALATEPTLADTPARPNAVTIIKKVLTFPPFLALLLALGLLLTSTSLPDWLNAILAGIGMTLIPAVMLAVGLQLHFSVPKEDAGPFFASLILKLLVLPCLAIIVFWLSPLQGLAAKVSLLEVSMPPMITAGAVAMAAGLKPRLVSAIIGYGVICSALTIPLWYSVIEWLL